MVAEHQDPRRPDRDPNPISRVARDDVPSARGGAADSVVGNAVNVDPAQTVPKTSRSTGIRANGVAEDQVPRSSDEADAVSPVAGDDVPVRRARATNGVRRAVHRYSVAV